MNATEPKLDKPGAGLPWPQRWIARLLVPGLSRKQSWEDGDRQFTTQARKISELVAPLDAKAMQTRVLVPRLRGLEDSSRYWSVAMTLEHLVITSEAMSDIVVKLSRGEAPAIVVDTAKVKPHAAFSADAAKTEFSRMSARVEQRLKTEVKDPRSPLAHPHPWFGRFTAHQWHWLVGSHLMIHKAQIREILKRLPVAALALTLATLTATSARAQVHAPHGHGKRLHLGKSPKAMNVLHGKCTLQESFNALIEGPCVNIILELVDAEGHELKRTRTEPDGRFEFGLAPTEEGRLVAASSSYEVVSPTRLLKGGESVVLKLKQK